MESLLATKPMNQSLERLEELYYDKRHRRNEMGAWTER